MSCTFAEAPTKFICGIDIQHSLGDTADSTFHVGLHSDVYESLSFKLGTTIYTAEF